MKLDINDYKFEIGDEVITIDGERGRITSICDCKFCKERKKMSKPNGGGYRGTEVFTGKCDVRLTTKQDSALSRLAERYGVPRSDVMRKALDDFVRWNEEE